MGHPFSVHTPNRFYGIEICLVLKGRGDFVQRADGMRHGGSAIWAVAGGKGGGRDQYQGFLSHLGQNQRMEGGNEETRGKGDTPARFFRDI